jgi:hypothetical protein
MRRGQQVKEARGSFEALALVRRVVLTSFLHSFNTRTIYKNIYAVFILNGSEEVVETFI